MANDKFTFEFEFKSNGENEVKKTLREILRDKGLVNSLSISERHNLREQIKETSALIKKTDAFTKKREEALKRERLINQEIADMKKKIVYAEKVGNAEEVKKLKNAINTLNIVKKQATLILKPEREFKKMQEEQDRMKALQETQEKIELRRSRDTRDAFRHNGLKAGFATLNPSKKINDYYDDLIRNNDSLIDNLTSDIAKKDAEIAANPENAEELKEERQALENKKRSLEIDNKKLASQQMMFNGALSSIKKFGNLAETVFKTMGIDLKSIMGDVISNIKSALDSRTGMATYDVGSSIFTNSKARETRMKYGLSASSGYALSQTMETLNMNSDEDLMYMNQNQKEVFNNLMDRYRTWYENLESTGALIKLQEAQLEFKMFKQELSMKLLNWFANHKDAIFKILEIVMWSLEKIANVVEWILDLIPGSSSVSSSSLGSSDTYNSNTNSSININVNNTNNATANLNNKLELETTLNNSNTNLVKQIATSLTSR